MITTQLGLLSLFLTISFTVVGDFVLHRAFRRGDSVRGDFVRGDYVRGILSGYPYQTGARPRRPACRAGPN